MNGTVQDIALVDCLALLGTQTIGRVAFSDRALPAVLPVTYGMDGQRVVFRTALDGPLGERLDGSVVAFEVDEVDEATRTGWSVVLVGVARLTREPSELLRVDRLWPQPWVGGDRRAVVVITPGRITGRRVGGVQAATVGRPSR